MSDDQWNKQYTRLAAVEEQLDLNSFLDRYVELYKKKFRGEPIFGIDNIHFKHAKDIQKMAGTKAFALVEHYFSMHDKWFEDHAYSLDCLVKNLDRVNADHSKRQPRELEGKLKIDFHCDACWKPFVLICDPTYDFLNAAVRCEDCTKANKPLKKLSKKERRKTVLKLGAAFPEMPKSDTNGDLL